MPSGSRKRSSPSSEASSGGECDSNANNANELSSPSSSSKRSRSADTARRSVSPYQEAVNRAAMALSTRLPEAEREKATPESGGGKRHSHDGRGGRSANTHNEVGDTNESSTAAAAKTKKKKRNGAKKKGGDSGRGGKKGHRDVSELPKTARASFDHDSRNRLAMLVKKTCAALRFTTLDPSVETYDDDPKIKTVLAIQIDVKVKSQKDVSGMSKAEQRKAMKREKPLLVLVSNSHRDVKDVFNLTKDYINEAKKLKQAARDGDMSQLMYDDVTCAEVHELYGAGNEDEAVDFFNAVNKPQMSGVWRGKAIPPRQTLEELYGRRRGSDSSGDSSYQSVE